ncbi:hypothetical protein SDC9_206221 [bioreactor metagenome]|uniref:Uncharacterized protein n=1 Tax=bioreactor metagenome TaxID=1076179 RepID=A0A645J4Z4_9ZZZZ
MARVGNAGLQLAVIGQQQQALAVGIEPASHIDTGHIDPVLKALPLALGRELAEHSIGLVKAQQTCDLRPGRGLAHHGAAAQVAGAIGRERAGHGDELSNKGQG